MCSVAPTDGADARRRGLLNYVSNSAVGDAETELPWAAIALARVEALFVGAATSRPLRRSGDEVQVDGDICSFRRHPEASSQAAAAMA